MTNNPDLSTLTADELRRLSQGCTELTCLYHGHVNAELVRRGESRRAEDDR